MSTAASSRIPHWFPVSRIERHRIPSSLAGWLLDKGSLTLRLQQRCPAPFRVSLLHQGYTCSVPGEREPLQIHGRQACLVRQVVLECDMIPMVYARTVIPTGTISGKQRRLAHLGNKSLGAVLFADKTMRRNEMEVARITPGQAIFELATACLETSPDEIWGRRSVFFVSDKPLLVSEVFLPTIATCKG